MRQIDHIYDAADVSAALGISPNTLHSALRRSERGEAPTWYRSPIPRRFSGVFLWDGKTVEEMRKARESGPVRRPRKPRPARGTP